MIRTATLLATASRRPTLARQIANLALWEWHAAPPRLLATPQLCRLFGITLPAGELTPGLLEQCVHPDDRPWFASRFSIASPAVVGAGHEFRVTLPDGDSRWLYGQDDPLCDADGGIIGRTGFCLDVSARKAGEAVLRDEVARGEEQLHALTARIESVAERERQLVGQEVHDELGQLLVALKLDIAWLKRRNALNDPRVVAKFADIEDLLGLTMSSTRRITGTLRPRMLDELGLVATIQAQLYDFRARGLDCWLQVSGEQLELDADRSLSLFRIFSEWMTNIHRHAGATRVRILYTGSVEQVHLQVVDNGTGIRAEQVDHPRSLGIAGMRERALRWGGTLTISGSPGQGSVLDVRLPCPPPVAGAAAGHAVDGDERRS
jgi:signal transduction histidine kinase